MEYNSAVSKLIEVEIFWEGDGWYFDYLNNDSSSRLGGPHIRMHDAWKQADEEGFMVVRANRTRGVRNYRPTPPLDKALNTKKEQDFTAYMASLDERLAKLKAQREQEKEGECGSPNQQTPK